MSSTKKEALRVLAKTIDTIKQGVGLSVLDIDPNSAYPPANPATWTWMDSIKMSSRVCSLDRALGSDMTVLNILMYPGFYLPRHKHTALERVFVLHGEYKDEETGETFRVGDVQTIPPGIPHCSSSRSGAVCVVTFSPAYIDLEDIMIPAPKFSINKEPGTDE